MKLKAPLPQHNVFHYFRNGLHSVIYDEVMDEPIAYGGQTLCDAFLTRWISEDARVYYYSKPDKFQWSFDRVFQGTGVAKKTEVG